MRSRAKEPDHTWTPSDRQIQNGLGMSSLPRTVLGAVLLLGVWVGGCTDPDQSGEPPRVLTIGAVERGKLSTAAGPTVSAFDVLRQQLTTERLVNIAPDGRDEPGLAERWTFSDDGRGITLFLRDNVSFHDGVRLSAELVTETLSLARTDPTLLRAHPSLGDIETIEVAGAQAVEVRFAQPGRLKLDGLRMQFERQVDRRPVGTGPFELVEETPERVVLSSAEDYHGGRPTIDRIEIKAYATLRTTWAAMMRGEVDFLFDVPAGSSDFVEAQTKAFFMTLWRSHTRNAGCSCDTRWG